MRKRLAVAAAVAAAAGLLALALWGAGLLDGVEGALWSYRVLGLAHKSPYTDRVRLIVIDQKSLDYMEKVDPDLTWPWPRQAYAPIVNFCKRAGAKVLVFDIIYDQPSVRGVEDDKAFAAALRAGPPVVLPMSLEEEAGDRAWPEYVRRRGVPAGGAEEWTGVAGMRFPAARFPVKQAAESATLLGNVKAESDADGIMRRLRLLRFFGESGVPSLPLAAYLAGEKTEPEVRFDGDCLQVGDKRLPVDAGGASLLRFRGEKGTHLKLSAAAVVESELLLTEGGKPVVDPETLRDCYVFLIPTAVGTHDLWATPAGKNYPGGEINATALDDILAADFLRETPAWLAVCATLLLALAAAFSAYLPRKSWHAAFVFVGFMALPPALASAAYVAGWWWPLALQSAAALLALLGATGYNYATEGRERRFIKQAFQHYLSPAVIGKILEDPSRLRLGGERRELTIFFSDLQGFTTLSEKLDPQELTLLLNDYLSDMTDIILDSGGTLDKYEGDAIIAFWNAPIDQPDHHLRAALAAMQCQKRLEEKREEFARRAGTELRMRIGMHSGVVVVGNMGSSRRFDYTMLGDAANLASRLEGANKALGTRTMLSAATWEKTGGRIVGRELGQLRVVGRKEPVRVYEPLGLPGEGMEEFAQRFEQGLAFCRAGRWREALEAFDFFPDDPASVKYAQRCRELLQDGGEWDGVWNLTSK